MDSSSKSSNEQIKNLYHRYKNCTDCDLHKIRNQIITGSGNPDANIFIIVDKVTKAAVRGSSVLAGPEKELLGAVFKGTGPASVWVSPVVLCSNLDVKDPKVSELRACKKRLEREIHLVQPKIVLALGGNAAKTMFPKRAPAILTNAGKLFESQIQGDLVSYAVPVMISYSLSYLLRNPDNSPGGLWNKFYNHIRSVHLIAEDLCSLKDSTYDKPTGCYN